MRLLRFLAILLAMVMVQAASGLAQPIAEQQWRTDITSRLLNHVRHQVISRHIAAPHSGFLDVTFKLDAHGRIIAVKTSGFDHNPNFQRTIKALFYNAPRMPRPPGALSPAITVPVYFHRHDR